MHKDGLLGILTALFSLAYIGYARSIEDSLLADSVGAGGVPLGLGIALFIASTTLAVKAFRAPANGLAGDFPEEARNIRGHVIAAALVAMLVAYALLVPVAGYIVTVSLLVLAVAVLARAPLKPMLLISSALSGILFWLLFEWALGIHMPIGRLFS